MPTVATGTWQTWNAVWTGGTAATTATVWANWNYTISSSTTVTTTYIPWTGWNTQYVETDEQKQARVRQFEVDRAARLQREAEQLELRTAAKARAEELLHMILSEAQVQSAAEHGHFDVIGSEGNIYRISTKEGISGNVRLMDTDNVHIMSFCAHQGEALPQADHFVSQMLAIQHDEREFRRIANVLRINNDKREKAEAFRVARTERIAA